MSSLVCIDFIDKCLSGRAKVGRVAFKCLIQLLARSDQVYRHAEREDGGVALALAEQRCSYHHQALLETLRF